MNTAQDAYARRQAAIKASIELLQKALDTHATQFASLTDVRNNPWHMVSDLEHIGYLVGVAVHKVTEFVG